MVENNTNAIAFCGLNCYACGSHKRNRCKGCKDGGGFASCKVRLCCQEKEFDTCAMCEKMESCKTLDNFISKVFGFIFRTSRKNNLRTIKKMGLESYIETNLDHL